MTADPVPIRRRARADRARQVADVPKDEGGIDRAPKPGTQGSGRKYEHGLDTILGLKETLDGCGTVRNEVRAAMRVPAPPAVARRLRLDPGEIVVFIECLRHLDDLPLSLDMTYLSPDVGDEILLHDLEDNDIFALIEHVTGQGLGSAEIALEAVAADAHSAATLQTPKGAALLLLDRLTSLEDGRPVDAEYIRFRGDRITMRGSMRTHPSPPANRLG